MSAAPPYGDTRANPYGGGQTAQQPQYGLGGGQQQQQPVPGSGHQGPPGLQLSIEEQRVLRDCNRESFWYRSLPLGALLASFTHVAIMRGMMKPNPRFGTGPKVIAASILGYFVGKFTYADKCADKFLIEAPHSQIAQAIRLRRGIPPLENIDGVESAPVSDSEQPAAGQSFPSPYTQETEPVPPLAPSYDQLRRRNREQGGGFVVPQPSPAVAPLPPSPPPYQQPPDSSSLYRPMPVPKGGNKYGDEGFE